MFCHQTKFQKPKRKKKYLQVHILPLFLHLCGNRKVCSWLRDVSRRFFLHSNACFLDGGWKVMLGKERGLCTISGCSMHLSSACCPNSSGTMGEESPLSLLVVCAFFIFFLSVMVLEKAARGSDSV